MNILALIVLGLVAWGGVKFGIYLAITQPHVDEMKQRNGGF